MTMADTADYKNISSSDDNNKPSVDGGKMNTNSSSSSCQEADSGDYQKLVDIVRNINSSCDATVYQATFHEHDLMKYNVVLPSGPRLSYEGLHEDEQKIINAQIMGEGVLVVKITLLAAGFVVGSKGRSIHSIAEQTQTTIKSWTLYYNASGEVPKALRAFKVCGTTSAILKTMEIINAAVDRYKQLTEGSFVGQSVNRDQVIEGITFEYRPPPKRFIPKSARTIQKHDAPVKLETFLSSKNDDYLIAPESSVQFPSAPVPPVQYSCPLPLDFHPLDPHPYHFSSSVTDYSPRDVVHFTGAYPKPASLECHPQLALDRSNSNSSTNSGNYTYYVAIPHPPPPAPCQPPLVAPTYSAAPVAVPQPFYPSLPAAPAQQLPSGYYPSGVIQHAYSTWW
eukprot:TRINITY_DN8323_c0_g1_i2.p1 TRINITY_DN8323_c0_g1~~TRINITY_DN8323_c0_g1_i2.p1  ORF type:complete len:395 (-),score=32.22 TRINITY_DN8323_c0_g1_i2:5477-6661(-)